MRLGNPGSMMNDLTGYPEVLREPKGTPDGAYGTAIMKYRSVIDFFFDRVVLEYPRTVILCMLVVVGFLAFQARHFRLDASSETLVLENDEDLRYTRLINSRYGKHDFLVLTYTPHLLFPQVSPTGVPDGSAPLFSEETLTNLARLRDELRSLERVASVISILDVPLLQSPPVSLKQLDEELPTLNSPEVDRVQAGIEISRSGLYRNLLLSPDLQTTAVLIYLADDPVYQDLLRRRNELQQQSTTSMYFDTAAKTSDSPRTYPDVHREKKRGAGENAERQQRRHVSSRKGHLAELTGVIEKLGQRKDELRQMRHQDIIAIRKIMDKYRRDADLFLGGVSMIADDMISFIKNDLKVFGLGVLLLLVLTLGVIFRKIRWILVPMLCCGVSVICMMGLLGWFGWEVTVVSSNFISLQLIMTLAIAIHLIVRYREILIRNPQASNRRLILDTVRLKLRPCVYSVATTIVGFGSLVFCELLPVITFGWMMVAGLIVSLIVTFLLFPVVLILLPKERPAGVRQKRFSLTSILAGFTEAGGTLILVISGIVLIFSIIGISKLRVENSFINYFNEDTEIYKGMKLIDQRLGGTTPLDVIVDFEKTDELPVANETTREQSDEVFEEFDEFDEAERDEKYWFTSEKIKRIKAVHQYLNGLQETGKVLSLASILEVAEKLNEDKPLDSFGLALLYSESSDEFRNMLIKPYVSVEHNQARFWVRVRDSEKTLKRRQLLGKIKEELAGELGFDRDSVHLAGLLVLYNDMLQSLFGSQIVTLGITVLLLTAMFLVVFRSLRVALIAILVNVFPVAVVLGVMGWLKTPLNMMTITIAAIGVGIGVDDAIHYIHRFKHEHDKSGKYLNTMYRCHRSIGYAMYYTSVTIIIGFSVLALSNFVPNVYFGLLTGLAMLIALLADLTLLPYMLILVKPLGRES